jgi:hypothetical protein
MMAGDLFASTFRRRVMPSLAAECKTRALLVALDIETFERGYQVVMRQAIRRGALHLAPPIFEDLADWTCISLGDAAASYASEIDEARKIAARVERQCRVLATASEGAP